MEKNAESGRSRALKDINVTPMVDVLLVLLIIFMVVTPVTQQGLDVAIPGSCPGHPDRSIVLTIDEVGGIMVNQAPAPTTEMLVALLRETFQARTDKTIFVRASGAVSYGDVVDVMDIAKGAGVERIGIVLGTMTGGASLSVSGAAHVPSS